MSRPSSGHHLYRSASSSGLEKDPGRQLVGLFFVFGAIVWVKVCVMPEFVREDEPLVTHAQPVTDEYLVVLGEPSPVRGA